jgi:hypothetical protein
VKTACRSLGARESIIPFKRDTSLSRCIASPRQKSLSRVSRALAEALVMISASADTRAIVSPIISSSDRYTIFPFGCRCTIIVRVVPYWDKGQHSTTPRRYDLR